MKKHLELFRDYDSRMVVSDLHIDGSDVRMDDVAELCRVIKALNPGLLIFLGDLGDRWKSLWPMILSSWSWSHIHQLVRDRDAAGLETVWVCDNHDHDAKPCYLSGATLCRSCEDDRYIYRHGWELDWSWGGIGKLPGIAPIAFFMADHLPGLMIPLYNLLFGRRHKTPGQTQPKRLEFSQAWSEHVGLIHLRAQSHAKKKGKGVIIGHTHCPRSFDGLMADCGDQVKNFTYLYWRTAVPQIHYLYERRAKIC